MCGHLSPWVLRQPLQFGEALYEPVARERFGRTLFPLTQGVQAVTQLGSKFTDEQILAIVKEGEAGRKVADVCRTHGITDQTYYRWKAKYGGMELSEMQRLKQVEDENRRLKQIVAEQTLDIQALKAVVAKKW